MKICEVVLAITKVIIPVAGLGTRFLPVTKSIPKAMIPVLNIPSIHYAVKEAVKADMTEVIIVMSKGQEGIVQYFENSNEFKVNKKDSKTLNEISYMNDKISIHIIYQQIPKGLGDAILQCKKNVNKTPFGVILPDDLILGKNSVISEMKKIYLQKKSSIIALKKVPRSQLPYLGVVDAYEIAKNIYQISGMIEKPRLNNAPSDLAIIGRYILPFEIFDILELTKPGINNEIQLTDAIRSLIGEIGVLGYQFAESHFDVGTPIGLLKASIHESMQIPEFANEIKSFMSFFKD